MKRPRFELRRVRPDGTNEPPQIVPVERVPPDMLLDRRSFFGTAVTAASVALMLKSAGCGDSGCAIPPKAHTGAVRALAFSPDGSILYSGGDDSVVMKAWSVSDRGLLRSYGASAQHEDTYAIAASSDAQTIVTGGSQGTVNVWTASRPTSPVSLGGVEGRAAAIAISPNGQLVVAGGDFGVGAIKLWSLTDRMFLGTLDAGRGTGVRGLAISPDSATLVAAVAREIQLFRLSTREFIAAFGMDDFISAIALTPDGQSVLSVTTLEASILRLWSLATRQVTTTQTGGQILTATMSPDGRSVFASDSGDVVIRSVPSLTRTGSLSDADGGIGDSIAVGPGGRLATGDGDGSLRLWDLNTRQRTYFQDPGIPPEQCPSGGTICACVPVFV